MTSYFVKFVAFLSACVLLAQCNPRKTINKFSDATLVRIADFQDRRLGDSLYRFFSHPDEVYRAQAALAFASIQDSAATELLGDLLLRDQSPRVRRSAAFALGQTGGAMSASLLMSAYPQEQDSLVQQTIVESIGKVANASEIRLEDYDGPGVPWLCYRLGLRDSTPPEFNKRVAGYLESSHHTMARLGAGHFFAGTRTGDISDAEDALVAALRNDPSAEVRMTAAWALRKIDSELSLSALTTVASLDTDDRVKINAVKALGTFPFPRTREVLVRALHDTAVNVSIAAAEVIQSALTEPFVQDALREARAHENARVQALLFQGANWILKSPDINAEIIRLYRSSSDNYQKAWLLSALRGVDALPFVRDELLTTGVPVIRSSAARVIAAMNREEKLTVVLREQFLDIYRKGIASGDVAVAGLFTEALADSSLHYRELVTDITFLHEAKARLSLPRDYESFLPLESAIAYFEGRQPAEIEKPFNHHIDWDLVRKIPAGQQATVVTAKGNITITLHVEDAPGSVANFVGLARRHYFDGKIVHRVVPNFVIQDGCRRGDGWGSEDYSIRSEFSLLRYGTGSVGMASAGKDTEGTQWFITHSPPPRLDGRYTIFATVTDGMDVVHRIEVGDTIRSIALSPPLVGNR